MAESNDYEEVFEEGPPKEAQTLHRIRANSSIMQLKKILGGFSAICLALRCCQLLFGHC